MVGILFLIGKHQEPVTIIDDLLDIEKIKHRPK